MTDQQALDLYQQLVAYWGDKLPDPDNYPNQFAYCLKMYRYYNPITL